MADFSNKDIIIAFRGINNKINELWCFVKECCSKVPINIGNGVGLYKQLVNKKWEFKSLVEGSNITITENDDDITISSTGGSTITGPPTEILYFDAAGNVTSDNNAVRDETTQQTNINKDFTGTLSGGFVITDNSIILSSPYVGNFLVDVTNNNSSFNGLSATTTPASIVGIINLSGDNSYSTHSVTAIGEFKHLCGVDNTVFNSTASSFTMSPYGTEWGFIGIANRKYIITDSLIGWNAGGIGFSLPETDGSAGDVMTTDGAGNITFQPGGGASFITAISDTNTVDLTVGGTTLSADVRHQDTTTINLSDDASGLKADFASLNISQFTNDSGYITTTGITPAALTKTDDTNVTLTLGGTPSTALLQATSLTLGWTGTLADGRIASSTNWNTAYTNRITSLTTTGTNGVATLSANTLNIPNYTVDSFTLITSNVVTTASTLSDVTGLSFPVTSGKTYRFSFMIPYTTAATNDGALFSINGATTSLLRFRMAQTTTSGGEVARYLSTYDAGTTSPASIAAGSMAVIDGILIASATGTVIARFACETALQTLTVKAGANVYYRQLD